MPRVILNRLEASNFMSFDKIDLDLRRDGLYLVTGRIAGQENQSNGSGKSALFEAIHFALFGESVRGVKISDLIKSGRDFCSVALTLEVGDREFKIVRKRVGQESQVRIYCNSQEISLGSVTEGNKVIEELIGFSKALFLNSVFFAQGLPYRFIRASDTERKEIMAEILGLDWVETLKENSISLKVRIEEEIKDLELRIGFQRERLLDLDKQVLKADDFVASLQENIKELESLIEKQTGENSAVRRKKDYILKNIGEIREERALLVSELGKIRELGLKIQRHRLEKNLSKKEKLENEIREWETRLEEIKQDEICPLCKRPLAETLSQVKAKCIKEIKALNMQLSVISQKTEDDRAILEELKKTENEKEEEISKLEILERLAEISRTLDSSKTDALEEQKEKMVSLLDSELSKKAELEREIRSLEESLESAIERNTVLKHLQPYAEFWWSVSGRKGLKNFLIDSYLPSLNFWAEHFSSLLLPPSVNITFAVENEKFVVKVGDKSKETYYEQFSGGERRRVDVAIMLALSQLITEISGSSFNIWVFDEVCENLDNDGIEGIIRAFESLSENRCIFVISHNSDYRSFFSKEIVIEKDRTGNSYIGSVRES